MFNLTRFAHMYIPIVNFILRFRSGIYFVNLLICRALTFFLDFLAETNYNK